MTLGSKGEEWGERVRARTAESSLSSLLLPFLFLFTGCAVALPSGIGLQPPRWRRQEWCSPTFSSARSVRSASLPPPAGTFRVAGTGIGSVYLVICCSQEEAVVHSNYYASTRSLYTKIRRDESKERRVYKSVFHETSRYPSLMTTPFLKKKYAHLIFKQHWNVSSIKIMTFQI